MKKPTPLLRDLISILKGLGGEATTRQISEASSRDRLNLGPRIGTGSVAFSLGYASEYVEYCGIQSKGNARWKLIQEPEPAVVKELATDPQSGFNFEDAS